MREGHHVQTGSGAGPPVQGSFVPSAGLTAGRCRRNIRSSETQGLILRLYDSEHCTILLKETT